MENLGSIWADITLNYAKYDESVKHIMQQNRFIDTETQRAMNRVGDHFDKVGKRMSMGLTLPLTLAARQWVKTFGDFQQSMANTQSVMGATTEELEQLTNAARRAGEETVYKASQAADALYYLAQSGMDAAQSIESLDGVLMLATASGSDLAFTSEVITASLSQFRLEASESTRVANLFAAANANSLASIDKLAGSLKNVGPIAAGFGHSIEETVAALMNLYNAGYQGEQAGTMLKRALSELANPTGDAIHVIGELGLSVNQLHPEMHSLADIMDTLTDAGITSTQTLRLFGERAGPAMTALLNQGSDAVRDYTEAITGTEKAAEQAQIQLDTLQGDIKIMQSVYESMVLEITQNYEPAMRGLVQQATELFGWIRDLNPETQRLIVTMGGFAVAAGPVMIIVGQLIKALPLLMGPTGLIYGGVAALTALGFAFAASERDMASFYRKSIENSRTAQAQADGLRDLVAEFKNLDGIPDKSEQEHRRLEQVMNEIVELQPHLIVGYEDMDEAIRANIGTLDTYIKTLEAQSELELRLSNIEYLRTRNTLESELNELYEKRAKNKETIEVDLAEANRVVQLKSEMDLAILDWEEALESGSEQLQQAAMEAMSTILVGWRADHVAKDGFEKSPWGAWYHELDLAAKKAVDDAKEIAKELEKQNNRITEILDIQASGALVEEELARRATAIETIGTASVDAGKAGVKAQKDTKEEIGKTTEEIERAIQEEMVLFRARINLVREGGEEYKAVYGELEDVHKSYIDFLEKNLSDEVLSEEMRGNVLATELGKMRDEFKKLTEDVEETKIDPNTVVTERMQAFNSELELLKLGVERYVDELGSLENHLESYYTYLQEQTADTSLTADTQLRVHETLRVVQDELDAFALTAEDRWKIVLDMISDYGPQADRLKDALAIGEIEVDFQDLERMEKHIKNYYNYLVESEQITLGEHLKVLEHQLKSLSVGTDEWLKKWREVASIDLTPKEMGDPLREQLQTFERLKGANDDLVSSYELQIEWLKKNVLATEDLVLTTEERMSVENEIYALSMANFRQVAELEAWTTEERLENLDKYVGEYAKSFDQIQSLITLRRELSAEVDQAIINDAQQVSYKLQEVEIQTLRNKGELYEAEVAESQLRLNRELDQYQNNAEMIELARRAHEERLITIEKTYSKQAETEAEQRRAEKERQEELWKAFLIKSRQTTAQEVMAEEVKLLEEELTQDGLNNEKRLQIERQLQEAKHDLAIQALEDQKALLSVLVMEEAVSIEERLDLVGRMRSDYEELYGNQYQFSSEWQELRRSEIDLEKQYAELIAQAKIDSIEYNENDLESLRERQAELLKLISETEDLIERQAYLNELMNVQGEIKQAQDATIRFFSQMAPKLSEGTQKFKDFNQMINESPQAFENLRAEMHETFGDLGDLMAGLYGGAAGFEADGLFGIISGISGAIAGFTGDPIFSAIATGTSLLGGLFGDSKVPPEIRELERSVRDINSALDEFGSTYQAIEADVKKKKFLGFLWTTGYEVTNEEAVEMGMKAGQAMLDAMNQTLSSLSSSMADAVANEMTWDDFQEVLGRQLQRILMEELLAAAAFEKEMKLLIGLMHEAVEGGLTQRDMDEIKRRWRDLFESLGKQWEEYQWLFEGMFPEDDTVIEHDVRGIQITRLSGQDRDLFLESLRPLSNLDRLPAFFEQQTLDLYQEFQMAEVGSIHAQELLIQQVLIQNVNVNLTGITDVHEFVENLVAEALAN